MNETVMREESRVFALSAIAIRVLARGIFAKLQVYPQRRMANRAKQRDFDKRKSAITPEDRYCAQVLARRKSGLL